MVKKENKIVGIQDFKELDSFDTQIEISVYLKYPEIESLIDFEPKVRKQKIKKVHRSRFHTLKEKIGELDFELIGTKTNPRGLKLKAEKELIIQISNLDVIERIFIKKEPQISFGVDNSIFAIKARFMIQIENRIKGIQDYEDRLLLVKAKNEEEAKRKLLPEFADYEKPYMNPNAELVRWKFECFIDSYETEYSTFKDMENDESVGIEVFSELKGRRLNNPSHIWEK